MRNAITFGRQCELKTNKRKLRYVIYDGIHLSTNAFSEKNKESHETRKFSEITSGNKNIYLKQQNVFACPSFRINHSYHFVLQPNIVWTRVFPLGFPAKYYEHSIQAPWKYKILQPGKCIRGRKDKDFTCFMHWKWRWFFFSATCKFHSHASMSLFYSMKNYIMRCSHIHRRNVRQFIAQRNLNILFPLQYCYTFVTWDHELILYMLGGLFLFDDGTESKLPKTNDWLIKVLREHLSHDMLCA